MNRALGLIPLIAMAALLVTAGCGTFGDGLLGVIRQSAVDEIKTVTSRAVDDVASAIERELLQSTIQNFTGTTTAP